MVDLGDVSDSDFADGEAKVAAAVENLLANHKLVMALGGDNSITY
jgi:formiminoglutamase